MFLGVSWDQDIEFGGEFFGNRQDETVPRR